MGKNIAAPLALAAVAATAAIGWAFTDDARSDDGPVHVEIVAPEPPKQIVTLSGDDEECKTGCSLAKHAIDPLEEDEFLRVRDEYATLPPDEPSKALETLLFYNKRTKRLLKAHGYGAMSEDHVAFLDRQLARDHAYVSVRFVDEADRVRVSAGPMRVPIGVKMHLQPHVLDDVQPMEINGTVVRTGLYHLWSRY